MRNTEMRSTQMRSTQMRQTEMRDIHRQKKSTSERVGEAVAAAFLILILGGSLAVFFFARDSTRKHFEEEIKREERLHEERIRQMKKDIQYILEGIERRR